MTRFVLECQLRFIELMPHSVERFSSRVENYARYRPGYPPEVIQLLQQECGLTPHSIIADLGSGTGKLAELFLKNGNEVVGVEPNEVMRTAAEAILSDFPRFRSVNGKAEATNLPDASVDFVTAGQAFHWFAPDQTKMECSRILKPAGWVVLVWNERLVDTTPFLRDYEALLLKYGTDYQEVRHENAAADIAEFFAPHKPTVRSFDNAQHFDFEGLKGRVQSSSYTPEPGNAKFEPMMRALKAIFENHEKGGRVSFDYLTKVYYGHLES